MRVLTKVAAVFVGLVLAFAAAWIAVDVRQRAPQGPEAQASAGMYAFGDLVLGVTVFGGVALVPLALGLYWLRAVDKFWSALTWGAMLFALTGLVALAANMWNQSSSSSWMLLSHARIGIMPLSALALLTCAILAPRARHRWLLFAAAGTDGTVFAGLFLVKILLPRLSGG